MVVWLYPEATVDCCHIYMYETFQFAGNCLLWYAATHLIVCKLIMIKHLFVFSVMCMVISHRLNISCSHFYTMSLCLIFCNEFGCSSVIEYLLMVWWVGGSIPHGGPVILFLVSAIVCATNVMVCVIPCCLFLNIASAMQQV